METEVEQVVEVIDVDKQIEQFKELATYDVNEKKLAEMLDQASKIKVASWEDEFNYESAKEAHRDARKLWNQIEARRKDLNRFPAALKKLVDNKAKKLQASVDKVTDVLKIQIDIRDLELANQELKKQQERQEIVNKRVEQLRQFDADEKVYMLDPEFCDDAKFAGILERAKVVYDANQARIAKEKLDEEAKDRELEKLRAENLVLTNNQVAQSISKSEPLGAMFLSPRVQALMNEFGTLTRACKRIEELEIELEEAKKAL